MQSYQQNTQTFVIGPNPRRLRGRYDQYQYWLDFMLGFTFEPIVSPISRDPKPDYWYAREVRDRRVCRHVAIDSEFRALEYIDKDSPEQYQLPFAEIKRITESKVDFYLENEWPTFERDEAGCIYEIKVNRTLKQSKVSAMLHRMCRGRFYYNSNTRYVVLQFAEDAVMVKLALK